MPTTKPRYTVTDTGETAELLDLAQRAWPEVGDRRRLLLRLARVGSETLREQMIAVEQRAAKQREGLERARDLVDVALLLDGGAWR